MEASSNHSQLSTPLQEGYCWKIKTGAIVSVIGELGSIDLIRCIKFASKEQPLSSSARRNLAVESIKLQVEHDKRCLLMRIVYCAIQILFTGTTLSAISLDLDPELATKLKYPTLISNAERAGENEANYQQVATEYKTVKVGPGWVINNPLLYHLGQAMKEEWRMVRSMLMSGKSLKDEDTKKHINHILKISEHLAFLNFNYEDKDFGNHPNDQYRYSFWVFETIQLFFQWVHASPRYNLATKNWEFEIDNDFPIEWMDKYNDIWNLVPILEGFDIPKSNYNKDRISLCPNGDSNIVQLLFAKDF